MGGGEWGGNKIGLKKNFLIFSTPKFRQLQALIGYLGSSWCSSNGNIDCSGCNISHGYQRAGKIHSKKNRWKQIAAQRRWRSFTEPLLWLTSRSTNIMIFYILFFRFWWRLFRCKIWEKLRRFLDWYYSAKIRSLRVCNRLSLVFRPFQRLLREPKTERETLKKNGGARTSWKYRLEDIFFLLPLFFSLVHLVCWRTLEGSNER